MATTKKLQLQEYYNKNIANHILKNIDKIEFRLVDDVKYNPNQVAEGNIEQTVLF